MKDLIANIISTQSGWLKRQILKGITALSGLASAWLLAKGVEQDETAAIAAGTVAILSALAEIGLSKAASKIAAK